MTSVETCHQQSEWDEYVLEHNGHPLQLWGWGEVKAAHKWNVDRVFVSDGDTVIGAAQLLIRTLPGAFKTLVYIPRGPVTDPENRAVVLDELAAYAKETYKALALTIEPDWQEFDPPSGWHQSTNTILIPHTLILDLHKTEEALLAAMSKKTRQYIRKSAAEDITIRRVKTKEALGECLEIYRETAQRAQFAIHDDTYYYDIFDKLDEASPVFAVFSQGRVVAFLWLVVSQNVAFELYGGVNDEGQRLRSNYALKWQAIQTIKKWGVDRYDMNGLLNDGVSTFKQSFADHEDMLAGTYDKPLSILYLLWNTALPWAKKLIRKLKTR